MYIAKFSYAQLSLKFLSHEITGSGNLSFSQPIRLLEMDDFKKLTC